jgi:hypothetical protein
LHRFFEEQKIFFQNKPNCGLSLIGPGLQAYFLY